MFLQAIPPESSVGNEKTPLLADWHGFGGFLSLFRLAPRRRSPSFGGFSAGSKTMLSYSYLWTELHQTRFPVFLQATPPESSVGNGKTPLLADWHSFCGCLAVFQLAPTTLPFAYPWTELHQTRFLGLLQAIPPESSVRNGKIPVLADYPNFAPWSNFWRFFGRVQNDVVLRLPLDRITPNSVSCVFAGHST